MIAAALLLPTVLALFGALRAAHEPWAALALILSVVGSAVYLAGNTGLPMFALSRQYAEATTEAQRAAIVAAAQAMLALGESHTPGTFVAFLLLQSGALLNSGLMLRSGRFARATAVTGLLGGALLLTFELVSDFIPALFAMLIVHRDGRGPAEPSLVCPCRSRPSSPWRSSPRPGVVAGRISPAQATWDKPKVRRCLGPPNNSMEPPPLRSQHPEAGDLRPIPASRVFGFGAILALGWPGGSSRGR